MSATHMRSIKDEADNSECVNRDKDYDEVVVKIVRRPLVTEKKYF